MALSGPSLVRYENRDGYRMNSKRCSPGLRARLGGVAGTICCWLVLGLVWKPPAFAGAYEYRLPDARTAPGSWNTVVGVIQAHTVREKQTLLDIARLYGLGFNEVQFLYPRMDPWIPDFSRKAESSPSLPSGCFPPRKIRES